MRQTLPAPGDPNKPKARRRPHGTDTLPEGPPRRKRIPKALKAEAGDDEDGIDGGIDDAADGDEGPAMTPRQGFEARGRAALFAGGPQGGLAMVSPTAAPEGVMAPPPAVSSDGKCGNGGVTTPARASAAVASMDLDMGASEP